MHNKLPHHETLPCEFVFLIAYKGVLAQLPLTQFLASTPWSPLQGHHDARFTHLGHCYGEVRQSRFRSCPVHFAF
jgi:hypothetical protein